MMEERFVRDCYREEDVWKNDRTILNLIIILFSNRIENRNQERLS